MQRPATHSEITRFVSSLLPPRANDVSLLYHVPRKGGYNFEKAPVEHVVLSVTPTSRLYEAIGNSHDGAYTGSGGKRFASEEARPPHTVCFLHRPFTLDRRRVRKDVLVLASHTSFDENLTIGWNLPFAKRLGMNVHESLCVQGYKADPERKIGIIGQVSTILGPLLRVIEIEFGGIEHAQEGLSEEIYIIAVMNAFSKNEVYRVLDMAQDEQWVPRTPSDEKLGKHVLYLTGQPRESGLAAAKEQGMTVVCVGHRVGEQWGINYLASCLRAEFLGVHIQEVYEDEYADTDGAPDRTSDGTDGTTEGMPDGLSEEIVEGMADPQPGGMVE
jgi:putative NIF3 family GTP cyclohydrolase 1 type 2